VMLLVVGHVPGRQPLCVRYSSAPMG
jgi:hypothetical protein